MGAWVGRVAHAWGKRPVRVARAGGLPIDRGMLFEALCAASAAELRGDRGTRVRVYAGDVEQRDVELFPCAGDGTLEAWVARLRRALRRRPFGVVASGLQAVSFPLFEAVAPGMAELFARVGLPPFGAEIGAFLGDYRETPFGVHQDRVGVVMWPLEGRKTIDVWATRDRAPPRVLEAGPRRAGVVGLSCGG